MFLFKILNITSVVLEPKNFSHFNMCIDILCTIFLVVILKKHYTPTYCIQYNKLTFILRIKINKLYTRKSFLKEKYRS